MKNDNNIDYNEKNKFDTLFNQWWDQSGKLRTLHKINPIRLQYIIDCSHGLFQKKILDVGCGGGILCESMAREGGNVTGLDVGSNIIKTAKKHASKHKLSINYICETIENYAYKRQQKHKYDIITCMEVLEHVPNPLSIIQACSHILKINGNIFFSTLNRTFKSWIIIIAGAEHIFKILPKGTHKFKKFIKPSELVTWLNATHFQERKITGLSYNIIKKQFKFSNNVDVNYILHAIRTF